MKLPPLQGKLGQQEFFIYAAADTKYFESYGRALINSVLTNTAYGIHMHIYDPTPDQLDFCQQRSRVSVSWEHLYHDQFDSALKLWSQPDLPEPYLARRAKMLGLKQFQNNDDLGLWLKKTYYACMRFVRLSQLMQQPQRLLEIDVDGLVRSNFATHLADDSNRDFYLYEKHKRNKITGESVQTGHLAGAILFTDKPQCLAFIRQLADTLHREISQDNVYWFLDQHTLDAVIPQYRKGLLPITYVDWHMEPTSAIWTAKGKRKDLDVFQRELAKYR